MATLMLARIKGANALHKMHRTDLLVSSILWSAAYSGGDDDEDANGWLLMQAASKRQEQVLKMHLEKP